MEEITQIGQEKNIISDLLYKNEVFSIIGAALEVHNNLGNGFLEPVYQEAFEIELKSKNIPFQSQCDISIHYKGSLLQKTYRADLVAYGKIIIELKTNNHLSSIDEAQVINYLKATKYRFRSTYKFSGS